MTILFQEDWVTKHPGAIIDYDTTNKSFLELAVKYKKMGINNHAMITALHNPDLVGIEPHSENLSMEEKAMILTEINDNFWYFIREVLRAPARSGTLTHPFRANRGSIALYWSFFTGITPIRVQPRQTGKSFDSDGLAINLLLFTYVNTNINLLTKDDKLRLDNIARIKELRSDLPEWLQMKSKKDSNNGESISVTLLGNKYSTHLPQKSIKMAANVGLGHTGPTFFIDEAVGISNISISMPTMLGAGGAARDLAKTSGQPYGTVITTNAGKLDDPDGSYVHNLLTGAAMWSEKYMDVKNLTVLHKAVTMSSSSGAPYFNCTFNHQQLGYTDEWITEKVQAVSGDKALVGRHYFNLWDHGQLESPLSKDTLLTISKSIEEPLMDISEISGYVVRWYVNKEKIENLDKSGYMVMGLDTSEAVGNDDHGMVLEDIRDGSTIAAGNFNEDNLIVFTEWLMSWFIKYPNFILIIERKSTASTMLDYLILRMLDSKIDPFKRIFNWVVNDYEEYPERFSEINKPMYKRDPRVYIKYRKYFGFGTSGVGRTSRSTLYGRTLLSSARHSAPVVKDKPLFMQINGLTIRYGRVDHRAGQHDDLVIAWLLVHHLLINCKNLYFYGIESSDVLCNTSERKVKKDNTSIYIDRTQNKLRAEFNDLIERLNKTNESYILNRIETRLRVLVSKLQTTKSFSYDEFVNDLKINKRTRRILDSIKNNTNKVHRVSR